MFFRRRTPDQVENFLRNLIQLGGWFGLDSAWLTTGFRYVHDVTAAFRQGEGGVVRLIDISSFPFQY